MAHYSFIREIFQAFWDYRFTQIEAARIMGLYPEIGKRHNEIYAQRKAIFKRVVQTHIENEEIVLPDFEAYENYLFDQYFIIAGSWTRFALLEEEQDEEQLLDHFARVNLSLFIPFMTDKGRAQVASLWN